MFFFYPKELRVPAWFLRGTAQLYSAMTAPKYSFIKSMPASSLHIAWCLLLERQGAQASSVYRTWAAKYKLNRMMAGATTDHSNLTPYSPYDLGDLHQRDARTSSTGMHTCSPQGCTHVHHRDAHTFTTGMHTRPPQGCTRSSNNVAFFSQPSFNNICFKKIFSQKGYIIKWAWQIFHRGLLIPNSVPFFGEKLGSQKPL